MCDISTAIEKLKENGIEAVECGNILTVPCSSPEEVVGIVSKVHKIFQEIDYQKSWMVDPYYGQRRPMETDV